MLEDLVHIKEGLLQVSYCGENLAKSSFDPFLYTTNYSDNRNLYTVWRVIHVGCAYPVFEQVAITINPNFCDHCLAGIGMVLLGNLGDIYLTL